MDALVTTRNLSRTFGDRRAVKGVSLSLRPGEVLGFLGPNGAGKSTTLRMLSGALAPTGGELLLEGVPLAEASSRLRRLLGYLPETPPLHDDLRVEEYLAYCAGIRGVPAAARRRAVDRAMERCGLSGHARRLLGQLSKGYRQRAGIAQAIVHEPRVILLDEPTSGLDPLQVGEIRSLIRGLAEKGRAVLLSTHILPEVQGVCNRVMIMRDGAVVHTGDLDPRDSDCPRLTLVLAESPAAERLADLEGVKGCRPLGPGRYELELRERNAEGGVAPQVIARGWTLLEMTPRRENLEETFARLTGGEGGPGP